VLRRAGDLAGTSFPAEVVEVTLEPKLNTLCIRFRKPSHGELGEPAHPQVHLFKDTITNQITAVEILEIDKLAA
jgi:hypothetical protein